jgi:UDP-glucose 4-epimerase
MLDKTHLFDLTVFDQIEPDVGEVDFIVHLAANARVHPLVVYPSFAVENVISTDRIYQFARKWNVNKVIIASSREVYGNALHTSGKKMKEEDASHLLCTNQYAAGKIYSEALAHAYKATDGIDTVILRFSNVYGKYDNTDRFVPLVIRNITQGKPIRIYGGVAKTMDFTFIDDAVSALHHFIGNFKDAKISNENSGVYNVAPGEGHSLYEVASMIMELMGKEVPLLEVPNRVGEPMYYAADTSKATSLGFTCETSIREGLKRAVDFYDSCMEVL